MMHKKDSVVIGTGYWGENIIKDLIKSKRLYAVIETNLQRAKIIENKYNVRIIKFNDLIDKKIKNCFITTPSYLHYKHCMKVIKYKKNIFVEKPLAFNKKEIETVIKKIKNKKIIFMVGYLLLHHPALSVLKEIIKNKINKIILIKSSRKSNGKIRPKDNVIWNLAIHDLAYFLDIFGLNIKSMKNLNFRFLDKKIDESKIHLIFKNNIEYSGEFSWLNIEKSQNITIQTDKEIYRFDDLSVNKLIKFKYKMVNDNQNNKKMKIFNQKIIKFPKISPLENEIKFFLTRADDKKRKAYNNLNFTKYLTKTISGLSKVI